MQKYRIHYESGYKEQPRPHEKQAAEFLAQYFTSDIVFRKTAPSKSPDLYICKTHISWELKSPIGNGKRTMENNLRTAKRQSQNIIIDLNRCKMPDQKSLSKIKSFLNKESRTIKRVKVILKTKKVIDILP